jgi:hypothetical protein
MTKKLKTDETSQPDDSSMPWHQRHQEVIKEVTKDVVKFVIELILAHVLNQ